MHYLYFKNNPDYIGLDIVGNISFRNLKPGMLKVSKKLIEKSREKFFLN